MKNPPSTFDTRLQKIKSLQHTNSPAWKKIHPIIEDFFYIEAEQWHRQRPDDAWPNAKEPPNNRLCRQRSRKKLNNLQNRKKPHQSARADYQQKTNSNVADFATAFAKRNTFSTDHTK